MEVYVPILGLENIGLEQIQPIEIRNLDAPGSSTMPPATNVNHALANLLIQIDTIYAISKKMDTRGRTELKAVFKFPQLNNPEIFQGQLNLDSIGLALLVKAYEETKKAGYTSRLDVVCATGAIAKYPTEADIFAGNFLEGACDIKEKLDRFIAFVNARGFADRKIAFVYSGNVEEEPLRERLHNSGLERIEVCRTKSFNQLQEYLFKARSTKPAYYIIPVVAIMAALAVTFGFLALFPIQSPVSKPETWTLLESQKLDTPGGLETKDEQNMAPLMLAIEEEDLALARRLIVSGARVNTRPYKEDVRKMDFLRRACEGPISSLTTTGNIEDNFLQWGTYWGDTLPHFSRMSMNLGINGADGGRALKLSVLKGEPYAFAHFYLNFKPQGNASRFKMEVSLCFVYEGNTLETINDDYVQAIELSLSKYDKKRRYELSWQYQNAGEQAPQWRCWDAASGWTGAGISHKIESHKWHRLSFSGNLSGSNVHYDSLAIDGTAYSVGKAAQTAPLDVPYEHMAAAIQLDSNFRSDPYSLYVRDFKIETGE